MKKEPFLATFLSALFMSIGMSCLMSFVMTAVNGGFTDDFVLHWLKGLAIGFVVSMPISLVFPPAISKLVNRILKIEVGEQC